MLKKVWNFNTNPLIIVFSMRRTFGRIPKEGRRPRPSYILIFFIYVFFFVLPIHFIYHQNANALLTPPHALSAAIKIRVRLTEGAPQVLIRGFDLKFFEGRKSAAATDRLTEWEIRCQRGHIRAFNFESGKTFDFHDVVSIESPSGFIKVQGRPYRETVRIYPARGSLCEVINEVDIEEYLDGLVNAEFSARWNEEAIAAQVIAARSYALHQVRQARKNPSSHFDVDATVRDQVYDGSILEDFRSSRAVDRTRGIVLVPAQNRALYPLKAFYHSTCGGKTFLPEQVWGTRFPGFKTSVSCPYCVPSPSYRWSVGVSGHDFSLAILKGVQEDGVPLNWPHSWQEVVFRGNLVALSISKMDSEKRVQEIKSIWVTGKESVSLYFSAARFRTWLGTTRIRSFQFQIQPQQGFFSRHWQIDGSGYGHGVGMCQWGAKVMGERGFTVSAILKHYYPDALIRKLW